MPRDLETVNCLLSSHRQRISWLKDLLRTDRFYTEEKTRLTTALAEFNQQLSRLETARSNAPVLIEDLQGEIGKLLQERKLLENAASIQKLRELQEQIDELQGLQVA